MARDEQDGFDVVSWARRVNSRWIAHHGLSGDAELYMDHLGASDKDRLVRSCRRARKLVGERMGQDDPKPWFYAGLFSLATAEEAGRFLAGRWFTRASIPRIGDVENLGEDPDNVKGETRDKVDRIRVALSRLGDEG
jgi:hypothetical protein